MPAHARATTPDAGAGARVASPVALLPDPVWSKRGRFGLVRFGSCSLAFLPPRPPRESIGFYYKDLYDGEGLVMEEKLQHSAIARALNRFRLRDLVSRRRPSVGDRHLDVQAQLARGLPPTLDRARAVFRTIACATIGFAGIAFSVSLLIIPLASIQYSPRVVHTLFLDPFNNG